MPNQRRKPSEWPRLSVDLEAESHPRICQSCGSDFRNVLMMPRSPDREMIFHWQEHDMRDIPEPIIVTLCQSCSAKIIDKHPRLYRNLAIHEPFPGVMKLCIECQFRDGTGCTHKDLKTNGGDGLGIIGPAPADVHYSYRRKGNGRSGHWEKHYPGPATECAGRDVI